MTPHKTHVVREKDRNLRDKPFSIPVNILKKNTKIIWRRFRI